MRSSSHRNLSISGSGIGIPKNQQPPDYNQYQSKISQLQAELQKVKLELQIKPKTIEKIVEIEKIKEVEKPCHTCSQLKIKYTKVLEINEKLRKGRDAFEKLYQDQIEINQGLRKKLQNLEENNDNSIKMAKIITDSNSNLLKSKDETIESLKNKLHTASEEISRLKQQVKIAHYGADEAKKAEIKSLKLQLKTLQDDFKSYVQEETKFRERMKKSNAVFNQNLADSFVCKVCPEKDKAIEKATKTLRERDERLAAIDRNAREAMGTVSWQNVLLERIDDSTK